MEGSRAVHVAIMASLCILGGLLNGATVCHVRKNFDTRKKDIFSLLLLDGLISCLGSFMYAMAVVLQATVLGSAPACYMPLVVGSISMGCGIFITAGISLIRCRIAYNAKKKKVTMAEHTTARVIDAVLVAVAIFPLYDLAVISLSAHLNLPVALSADICMGRVHGQTRGPPAAAIFGMPLMLAAFVAIFASMLTACFRTSGAVSPAAAGERGPKKPCLKAVLKRYTIPAKATMLSATFFLASVFLSVNQRRDKDDKYITSLTNLYIVITVLTMRFPLGALLTLGSKRGVDRDTRKARLEWELRHAREALGLTRPNEEE